MVAATPVSRTSSYLGWLGTLPKRGARRASGARKHLTPGHRLVALTFDDGPDWQFTPAILDVLREAHVPATFFMVGRRARQFPDVARRVVDEGHAVGSHSDGHPDMWALSARAAMAEYIAGRREVESVVGRPVTLFRPPNTAIPPAHAPALRFSRLRPWVVSLDSLDWQPGATSESIAGNVANPRDGEVILFHDGLEGALSQSAEDRSATVEALPLVIEAIRRRGFGFSRLY